MRICYIRLFYMYIHIGSSYLICFATRLRAGLGVCVFVYIYRCVLREGGKEEEEEASERRRRRHEGGSENMLCIRGKNIYIREYRRD